MDYTENEDEQNGVTKWPFYMAALFIISLVIGFAYLHLKVNETLDDFVKGKGDLKQPDTESPEHINFI